MGAPRGAKAAPAPATRHGGAERRAVHTPALTTPRPTAATATRHPPPPPAAQVAVSAARFKGRTKLLRALARGAGTAVRAGMGLRSTAARWAAQHLEEVEGQRQGPTAAAGATDGGEGAAGVGEGDR